MSQKGVARPSTHPSSRTHTRDFPKAFMKKVQRIKKRFPLFLPLLVCSSRCALLSPYVTSTLIHFLSLGHFLSLIYGTDQKLTTSSLVFTRLCCPNISKYESLFLTFSVTERTHLHTHIYTCTHACTGTIIDNNRQ